MKKNIIILCTALTTIILIAFGFSTTNRNDAITNQVRISSSTLITNDKAIKEDFNFRFFPDFFYDVGTRFRGIKKNDLNNPVSVIDFLPKEDTQSIVSYTSVSISILEENLQTDTIETGTSEILTTGQIKLLQSANYATNIWIRADYKNQNNVTGKLEDNYVTPYLTVVPEKQAIYNSGKPALINYLKENSRIETTMIQENKLRSGRLIFTVTKKGVISNVKLTATSGYPHIDKKMIELIHKAPGKWKPAENSKGEKIDQDLVFTFGSVGC